MRFLSLIDLPANQHLERHPRFIDRKPQYRRILSTRIFMECSDGTIRG
ncbi:MAG: hypothetical protein RL447_167 [Bacteroidota bacterium]|jgi:hypothetical protein